VRFPIPFAQPRIRLDLERLRKLGDGIVVPSNARQCDSQAVMHTRIVRFQSRLGCEFRDRFGRLPRLASVIPKL